MTPFCFFCGGNTRRDGMVAVPRPYEPTDMPCSNCIAQQGDKIAIFEVVESDPGCGNMKLIDGVWYTGRWTVVRPEDAEIIFGPKVAAGVLETRVACLRADNYHRATLDHYPWRVIQ